jgi:hypothetical protein
MKTKLLMFYDDNRKGFGEIATKSAEKFCKRHGFDICIDYRPTFNHDGFMLKPHMLRDHLNKNDCDWLIYIDSDIMFRGDASTDGLFEKPINISTDGGLCVGFMTLQNTIDVRKYINIWADLGHITTITGQDYPHCDQSVFMLIYEHFQWARNLVHPIPQTLVSNPRSPNGIGSIAHHFWSSANDSVRIMHQFYNELG